LFLSYFLFVLYFPFLRFCLFYFLSLFPSVLCLYPSLFLYFIFLFCFVLLHEDPNVDLYGQEAHTVMSPTTRVFITRLIYKRKLFP
jgi:hypothetical protein